MPASVGRSGPYIGRPGLRADERAAVLRTDPLTVIIGGTASGSVTSNPSGITCAGGTVSCTGWFTEGITVQLTATPDTGFVFVGWSGACTGTAQPCEVPIHGVKSVGAHFASPLEFYHLDVLGSVRMVTNAAGAVVKRHDYFAFGEDTAALTGDPRRFTGKELDPETAQQYFGARYYRNVWGRFTGVDPVMDLKEAIPDPQRWNRYDYARNGPLRFIDPDGRNILAVAAAVVGLLLVLEEPANAPGSGSALFDGITNLVEIGETTFYSGLGGVWGRFVVGPLFGRAASTTVAAARKVGAKGPTGGSQPTEAQYKVRKPGISGKEAADNAPSWALGQRPKVGENGRTFAERLLDEKYGPGNYKRGPGTEFNQIQKYGDRAFMDPPGGK